MGILNNPTAMMAFQNNTSVNGRKLLRNFSCTAVQGASQRARSSTANSETNLVHGINEASLIETTILSNGIRVATLPSPTSHFLSLGVLLGIGTRHENNTTLGSSHLLEKMAFKVELPLLLESAITRILLLSQKLSDRYIHKLTCIPKNAIIH